MITFQNKILFVGFGAVARCTLPILVRHISVDPKRITIMDFDPNDAALQALDRAGRDLRQGPRHAGEPGRAPGRALSAGDLLIDLAWNIDCCEIVQWCHDHGVLYINTSVELWDPYAGAERQAPDRTDALLAPHEPARG